MDLVNIGAKHCGMSTLCIQFVFLKIVEFGKIDPAAVKGHVWINNSTVTSRYENFLAPIRVEKHQIGSWLHVDRVFYLWPPGIDVVTVPWCTDIDNIVFYS
jgi:hypothetical protein